MWGISMVDAAQQIQNDGTLKQLQLLYLHEFVLSSTYPTRHS